MRFFKLTLSYDGTAYAGWQVQSNARTIQAEVEKALRQVTGEDIRVLASGRTDAGVHAIGQVIGFRSETYLSPEVLCRAIDAHLPFDIIVLDVCEAPDGFHPIRDALRKRYRYVIQDGPLCDVFARAYAWFIPQRLDVEAMSEAALTLMGEHDFSSFEASGAARVSSVRTILDLSVRRQTGDFMDRVVIEVEANGFLYNMVRIIVGSLVAVGQGKRSPDWIAQVLRARDRRVSGVTAPPHGLFLVHVEYGW
jgi:tRNA pseudouridine38-40 synthase